MNANEEWEKMAKEKLKIQNIVATASLGKKVPLVKLAGSETNTEYSLLC